MKAYSGMPVREFIAELRESAIRTGAAPAVIHKIDELRGVDEDEEEIEKIGGELAEMEEQRNLYRDALRTLLDRAEMLIDTDEKMLDAIAYAKEALEE